MKHKKLIITLLKLGISVVLIYWVFTKIEFKVILDLLQEAKVVFLLLALLAFVFSQWLSSFRLRYLLQQVNCPISVSENIKLYVLGMFYNFFIPGGIGGDAYKIFYLKNRFKLDVKSLTSAVFVDRLLGLFAIVLLLLVLATTIDFSFLIQLYPIYFIILGVLFVVVSYLFVRYFFKRFEQLYTKGMLYSIGIQSLQVLSVYFILQALGVTENLLVYFAIFLLSSILSLLSFAGIGVREYIFYQASVYLSLQKDVAISTGLLFSIITALVSLFGIIYFFKPIKKT